MSLFNALTYSFNINVFIPAKKIIWRLPISYCLPELISKYQNQVTEKMKPNLTGFYNYSWLFVCHQDYK